MKRLTYEESCIRLQKDYLGDGIFPPMPSRMPKYDDDELGVSFHKTFVGEGDDLSNLTLPRTFIGRSEINDAKFRNTDFNESNMCWNDFINVDFTGAILNSSDLRASSFKDVKFINAQMIKVDFRGSGFENCIFIGADMSGVILTKLQGEKLILSPLQKSVINWAAENGLEPEGS